MHGQYCFQRDTFRLTLLVKAPGDGWDENNTLFRDLIETLTSELLTFYSTGDQPTKARITYARRDALPRRTQRLLKFAPIYATAALQTAVVLKCEGCSEPGDDDDLWYEIAELRASMDIQRWVHDLTFAANIARPGSMILLDGVIQHRGALLHSFFADYTYSRLVSAPCNSGGSPPLLTMELRPTWSWLRAQPGFNYRFGGGPIGRALNALTHVASGDGGEAARFLWAMIGLEALFNRTGHGLRTQLRSGLALLLPDWPEARAAIDTLYTMRSKFVHGSLDFVGQHLLRTSSETWGEPDDEALRDATDTAAATLLATVQQLAIRAWSDEELARALACSS